MKDDLMIEKLDEIRRFAQDHLMYTGEVAKFFHCTPQAVSNLVSRGRLHPLKTGPGSNLFLREEVENFKPGLIDHCEMRRRRRVDGPRKIIDQKHLAEFLDSVVVEDVEELVFYGYPYYAAMGGHLTPRYDYYVEDKKMIPAKMPNCVVYDVNNREKWLRGLEIGYNGKRTDATFDVLVKKFGMTEDLAKKVYDSELLIYAKDSSRNWFVKEQLLRSEDFSESARLGFYFYQCSKVVTLTLDDFSYKLEFEKFVPSFSKFLKNPSHIEAIDEEIAMKSGMIEGSYSGAGCPFQVVIRDRSGVQVWLNIRVPDMDKIPDQSSLEELFQLLDIPLKKMETLPVYLQRVLKVQLPIEKKI